MGLYKRGKTWWLAYTDPNGELVRRSAGCRSKKTAEGVWAGLVISLRDGTFIPEDQRKPSLLDAPRIDVALTSYLEDREARGRRTDSYRKLQDWSAVFAGRQLHTIKLDEVV